MSPRMVKLLSWKFRRIHSNFVCRVGVHELHLQREHVLFFSILNINNCKSFGTPHQLDSYLLPCVTYDPEFPVRMT